MDSNICPYTGLRPFTEEESIYFKGRDEHIDSATRQLGEKKFIMITGASGDGKSSLVYAGVIPNAKAGFLKAAFSNWCVVDFRPERNPLGNLSRSFAQQLGIGQDIVQTELNYGFSALVDMYKASSLYYNTNSVEWLETDIQLQRERKRKASNLIVLADQFEEFFTNPENFQRGAPSQEAVTVVNLLLETARIALDEGLPIYVIITMRSDFVGQCASFRGLPEYIGFSQFFLPRLNRKELQEVIEDPAELSGNKISRRLTERLIYDMVDGLDQLPTLQHALNQIWKMADNGSVEMDLLQYAMVGGIAANELPADQVDKFNQWFSQLPKKIQDCYRQPGLDNVLNTHADKLFNRAVDNLSNSNGESISEEEAKHLISAAFKCLTKIDNGRAVRNRMTLGEITAIINDNRVGAQRVGLVLSNFRESGNTLLRPFKDNAPELTEDSVLDITHESLIRNWENLKVWAQEEYESHLVSLDFGQQMDRWLKSGKSGDYLLSIGPLAYFEGWINKYKPGAAWIARYMDNDDSQQQKIVKAKSVVEDAKQFLKRSARKHLLTRTMMRYSSRQITTVFAVFAFLVFSSFVLVDYYRKQNSTVQKDLKQAALQFSKNSNMTVAARAEVLNEGMMYKYLTPHDVVKSVPDNIGRLDVMNGMIAALLFYGQGEPKEELLTSLLIVDSLLTVEVPDKSNPTHISSVLKEVNDFMEEIELTYFYNPLPEVDELRAKNAKRCADWVSYVVNHQPERFTNINELNAALEHAINFKAFSNEETQKLIEALSPLEAVSKSLWVQSNFQKDKIAEKGFFGYGFSFNGLYQELAYLYAATGNTSKALQCIDSLLTYKNKYFESNYDFNVDNAYHIAGVFYRHGNISQLDEFVKGYVKRRNTEAVDFYARLVARCKTYEFSSVVLNFEPRYDLNLNLILEFSSDDLIKFFFSKYRGAINERRNEDEREFLLALAYKDEATMMLRKLQVSNRDSLASPYFKMLDQAVTLFRNVSQDYLNEEIDVTELTFNDEFKTQRKFLFLFPDIRTPFHPNEPKLFHFFFTTDYFLDYMLKNGLIKEFYTDERMIKYLDLFIRDYSGIENVPGYTSSRTIRHEVLVEFERQISEWTTAKTSNISLLYLYLGKSASLRNEKEKAINYYSKITSDGVRSLFINSFDPTVIFRLVGEATNNLCNIDKVDVAIPLIRGFNNPINRSSLYAYAAGFLEENGAPQAVISSLIDSARKVADKVINVNSAQPNRTTLAYAYALNKQDLDKAYTVIRNINNKSLGLSAISRAVAYNNDLYLAYHQIPEITSQVGRVNFVRDIWFGYGRRPGAEEISPAWENYRRTSAYDFQYIIDYVDGN